MCGTTSAAGEVGRGSSRGGSSRFARPQVEVPARLALSGPERPTLPEGIGVSTHLKTMGMVELSPSLREGREVTSGEGRRQASDDSKRTMTKKSPIPFTTNRARSLLAERLQTNWVFRMSSRNVKRQELVCAVSRQRKSNTGLAAALPSLSLTALYPIGWFRAALVCSKSSVIKGNCNVEFGAFLFRRWRPEGTKAISPRF